MPATPALLALTTFTIDGVDFKPYLLTGYESEAYGSGRQVTKFSVLDKTGSLTVPDLGEVVLVVGGVTEFSGVVWDIQIEQFGDVYNSRLYTLQCVDWSFGLDVALINGIYAAGTLKSLLTSIIANASSFGITLDPSQADGPTLPAQAWDTLTLRQAIDRIVGLSTGWMWRIDPATKYFRAYEPYTLSGPRSFDETDTVNGSGLYQLKTIKNFGRYINSGYVVYGPSGPDYVTDHIVGNGTDGTYTLVNTYLQMNATGTLTYTVSGTPATQTVSEDGTGQWTLNRAANTITRNGGVVASGDTIDFQYLAQFPIAYPFIDSAGVAANGNFVTVVRDETILTAADAAIVANGVLRRNGGPYRTVSFNTMFGAGIRPLQTMVLNFPSLGIASTDDFLVSEVRCREVATRDLYGALTTGSYFEWSITAQEGLTIYDWLDELREAPLPSATAGMTAPPTTAPVSLYATVQSRTKGHNSSDTTSHSISLPSIVVGQLLLVIFTVDGNPTVTVNTGVSGSGWTKVTQVSITTFATQAIFWKIATGSDVLTLTTSASEQASWVSLRISGAHPTAPIQQASVTSSGTNVNPPPLTPTSGQLSYLWIATFGGDSNVNYPSVSMASYTNFYQEVGTNSGATTAIAERLLNASTEDPNTWVNGLVGSVAFTIAVRPA